MLNLKVIMLALIGISTLKIVNAIYVKKVKKSDAIISKNLFGEHGFRLLTTHDLQTEFARKIVNIAINEDPLCIATGVSSDESSRVFLIDKWLSYIQQNKSFVWIRNGVIIAMNILYVDDGSTITSFPARVVPELSMYYKILNEPNLSPNMSTKYELDLFLTSAVFWINRLYRTPQNLQTVLQFSEAICVTENYEAISSYFTWMDETAVAESYGYNADGKLSALQIVRNYRQCKIDQIPNGVSRRTIKYNTLMY